MCTSKPKAPKPVPNAPIALPASIDQEAVTAQRDERRRQRNAYGRQQTILAGAAPAGSVMPTAPVKTALGM